MVYSFVVSPEASTPCGTTANSESRVLSFLSRPWTRLLCESDKMFWPNTVSDLPPVVDNGVAGDAGTRTSGLLSSGFCAARVLGVVGVAGLVDSFGVIGLSSVTIKPALVFPWSTGIIDLKNIFLKFVMVGQSFIANELISRFKSGEKQVFKWLVHISLFHS